MRRRRNRRAMAVASVAVGFLIGCQVIVGGDVPEFTCAGSDPGACPAGMTCDTQAGRGVSGAAEGGMDRIVPSGDAADAANDRDDRPPESFGKVCSGSDDCPAELLCGTVTLLSDTIITSGVDEFCTKSCCSSADCPSSYVCFGAGTGGNYCVPGALLGKANLGTAAAGAACTGDGDCRSGLCREDRCVDACCTNDNCETGSLCRKAISDSPPLKKGTWACGAFVRDASLPIGESCSGPSGLGCPEGNCCENRNCATVCRPPCCTTAQCLGHGGNLAACAYATIAQTNGGQTRFCIDRAAVGDLPVGAACTSNSLCATYLCIEQKCAEPCCVDSDCAADEVCKPSQNFLRCVPKEG